MGKKDIEEKQFEDYNDVFADIFNVLVFEGKQVIKPNELENTKDKSRFKALSGKITEQERDVAKWWRKNKIRFSLFGLENQTKPDKKMCLKLYGYDGAAYKSEYYEEVNYPVVTLVLYFGHKYHWKAPKSLYEMINVSDELKPFVNNYHMNLCEIAWLTDEQVNMFKSDFRIVADYFVQMRKNKEYVPSPDTIKHVDSVMKLMTALTGDSRFEDSIRNVPAEERRKITMCKAFDDVEKRGEKRGRFSLLVKIVNDYIEKNKTNKKEACVALNVKYSEYMTAQRYLKSLES